jgi:chromate transporter
VNKKNIQKKPAQPGFFLKMWKLFWSFFKIGAFTIGGGYAMLPLIQEEVISKRQWLQPEEFLDGIALSQSLPGPIAVNIAVFTGYRLYGFWGSVIAVLGVTIPSFVSILLIAMFLFQYSHSPLWERIFKGIRPAVVALIAVSLINIGKISKLSWKTTWLPVVVFVIVFFWHVSPALAIIGSGVAGLLLLQKKTV